MAYGSEGQTEGGSPQARVSRYPPAIEIYLPGPCCTFTPASNDSDIDQCLCDSDRRPPLFNCRLLSRGVACRLSATRPPWSALPCPAALLRAAPRPSLSLLLRAGPFSGDPGGRRWAHRHTTPTGNVGGQALEQCLYPGSPPLPASRGGRRVGCSGHKRTHTEGQLATRQLISPPAGTTNTIDILDNTLAFLPYPPYLPSSSPSLTLTLNTTMGASQSQPAAPPSASASLREKSAAAHLSSPPPSASSTTTSRHHSTDRRLRIDAEAQAGHLSHRPASNALAISGMKQWEKKIEDVSSTPGGGQDECQSGADQDYAYLLRSC